MPIPAGSDTPFGLTTRGSAGYVTIALAIYKPAYTIPGLVIVALGVPAFFLFRRKRPA